MLLFKKCVLRLERRLDRLCKHEDLSLAPLHPSSKANMATGGLKPQHCWRLDRKITGPASLDKNTTGYGYNERHCPKRNKVESG